MEFKPPANFGEYQLTYRSGDMVVPRVDAAEPLSLELQDFARDLDRRPAALERGARRAGGRRGDRGGPDPPANVLEQPVKLGVQNSWLRRLTARRRRLFLAGRAAPAVGSVRSWA